MSGATSIPFAFAALYFGGSAKMWFWLVAFVALWICVFRMGWKNYQLFEKIKSNAQPCLGIEGITSSMTSSDRHQCQIRISTTQTADNINVELLSFENELSEVGKFINPSLPVVLQSESGGSSVINLNPGSSQKFNLFQAVKSDSSKNTFIAYFSAASTQDVALFRGKKLYRLKLSATARDLRKHEEEFFLKFSCAEHDFPKFVLMPVNSTTEKEAKQNNRALILETLGQFRFALLERAKEINKMPSDTWHKENQNDVDTHMVRIFGEIENFFTTNPAELGTNAFADFRSPRNLERTRIHNNFGDTIYHDGWEWAQNLLRHSEKNLAEIADKLNSKPV